jgi:preprotein translocase subunit SecD
MKLAALAAALAVVVACGAPPDASDHAPIAAHVEPAPWHSRPALYIKVVDDTPTYMQQLFEQAPADRPIDVTTETDRYRTAAGRDVDDLYLAAPEPERIAEYLASDPALAVPRDRELAFGRIADGRWRMFLLVPTVELDASAIAHAEATLDASSHVPAVMLDLTPAGAQRLAELTTRALDHRIAVEVDGTVVSAPWVRTPITGGRVEVTFAGDNAGAAARALADALGH